MAIAMYPWKLIELHLSNGTKIKPVSSQFDSKLPTYVHSTYVNLKSFCVSNFHSQGW